MSTSDSKKSGSSGQQSQSKPKVNPKWMRKLVKGGKVGQSRKGKPKK